MYRTSPYTTVVIVCQLYFPINCLLTCVPDDPGSVKCLTTQVEPSLTTEIIANVVTLPRSTPRLSTLCPLHAILVVCIGQTEVARLPCSQRDLLAWQRKFKDHRQIVTEQRSDWNQRWSTHMRTLSRPWWCVSGSRRRRACRPRGRPERPSWDPAENT